MMKKLVSMLAIAALTAIGFSAALAGQNAATGVNGSMHDITYLGQMGSYGYNQDDFQRVCIFCHTPHNAQPNGSVPAPLWNHEESTVDLPPYTWAAPANLPIPFDVDPLIGPSRLCMGCHDGITAVDKHGPSVGTAAGTTNYKNLPGTVMASPGRIITDLTVTHPIGFLYQDAVNARGTDEVVNANTNFLDSVPMMDASINTYDRTTGWSYKNKKISDTLYGGYLTCASCHEVHNTKNAVNDPAVFNASYRPNYFVWSKETGSALCLSCHYK
jgi:hypothetical protein